MQVVVVLCVMPLLLVGAQQRGTRYVAPVARPGECVYSFTVQASDLQVG